MSYELRAEELAAQEVLALPDRELLQPTNTVSPAQLALALNLADITTGDVGGDVGVGQANDVTAEQNTTVAITNEEAAPAPAAGEPAALPNLASLL